MRYKNRQIHRDKKISVCLGLEGVGNGVTAKRCGVSSGDVKKVLKLIVVLDVQL